MLIQVGDIHDAGEVGYEPRNEQAGRDVGTYSGGSGIEFEISDGCAHSVTGCRMVFLGYRWVGDEPEPLWWPR